MKEVKKKSNREKKKVTAPEKKGFQIPYPFLLLSVIVVLLYVSSVSFDFTELDDSIFIKEQHAYNEDLTNLVTSFRRGVFNPTEDVYYRPLLLDSFILNYQVNGTNIKGYHIVNIFLHLLSVLLLFVLLKKLRFKEWESFLLSLLFSVHPVLSQAVAWIPGRNDTLLAVFVFSFFICAINYAREGKITSLLLQFILLLLAFFTKETAVFAPPVAFLLLLLCVEKKWLDRNNIMLYGSWALAFLLWFYIRSLATLKNEQLQLGEVILALPSRLSVLLQYLGKIILPFNLSVFPIAKDTTNIYGIITVLLLAAGIYFSREKNLKVVVAGIGIFLFFLIPVLLVPGTLNDQDFEHRLYLPMLGILLLLSQTVLFKNNWSERNIVVAASALCFILALVNFNHQKKFSDPITFWTEAVSNSPHSAYANMMLGARLNDSDKEQSHALIKTAYALNPDEKYLNFYMGKMVLDQDSVIEAEKYFLKEIKKSDYYECYFHLARIAFTKNDFNQAIEYLHTFLARSPDDPQGNNNLLLLYMQTNQTEKAKNQLQKMQQLGLEIPPEALQLLK
ncbi:MAG: glycosyltransferase family 39 protein [Chitinophagaceae bacterium]|nr:glycosyltransferase family 39 protein [Chitinophagaceae bacterium]